MQKTMGIFLLVSALVGAGGWALWTPDIDRPSLEAKYLAAPDDMVTVMGNSLHVRDSAPQAAPDKPVLLLLHGFGASLHTWEVWTAQLSQHFRVLRVDLPGSGLSGPDAQGDYSDTRTIALLLALMDQRGIARASIIGHSIGGRIAWTLAASHPTRVDKLVLLAPDGFASPGFAYGSAPEVPATMGLMRYTLPRWMLRSNLLLAYADPATLSDGLLTRYYELMLAPGSRAALLARMQQTVLVDPVPLLRRITAPTLLVWGRQDGMIPFANAADYQREIPRTTLLALDNMGHLPHEESPQRALPEVEQFLMEPSRD